MARYPVPGVLEISDWSWGEGGLGGAWRRFDGVRKPRGGAESFVDGGGNGGEMAFDGVGDFVYFIVDKSEVRNEILGGEAVKHILIIILRHFEE